MSTVAEPERDPEQVVIAGVMEVVWDTLNERIPAYEGARRLANVQRVLGALSEQLISFLALEDDWIEHPDDRAEIERDILGAADRVRSTGGDDETVPQY